MNITISLTVLWFLIFQIINEILYLIQGPSKSEAYQPFQHSLSFFHSPASLLRV